MSDAPESRTTDLVWDAAGKGPHTVVWGHGLTGSRAADDAGPFAGLRTAVVDAGWRHVRYDARGHGHSPKPADEDLYRWDRLAGDVLAVADAAGADRFCAAGASMGAATALFAAVRAPERVQALVLVIPPTAWETRAAQGSIYQTSAAVAEAEGLPSLVALARELPPTTFLGEEGKTRSLANLAAMDPVAYPHVMGGAAASDLPEPAKIAEIHCPTLVLAWSDDAGHPISTAERLADLLPQARLSVATSPEEVAGWAGQMAEFLRSL